MLLKPKVNNARMSKCVQGSTTLIWEYIHIVCRRYDYIIRFIRYGYHSKHVGQSLCLGMSPEHIDHGLNEVAAIGLISVANQTCKYTQQFTHVYHINANVRHSFSVQNWLPV